MAIRSISSSYEIVARPAVELRRPGGLVGGKVRDNLLPVVERFPDNATMRYNLACYECQLGRQRRRPGDGWRPLSSLAAAHR